MRLVRDDAPERVAKALQMIKMARRNVTTPELITQALNGIEHTLEILMGDMDRGQPVQIEPIELLGGAADND